MFVIINLSFLAYDDTILPLFILLIAIWYLFACMWHLSDSGLRPLRRYLDQHVARLSTFVALLVLAYDPFSLSHKYEWYLDVVMGGVIVAMTTWNVYRLKKYLVRDFREYNCDYVEGHPKWSSQTNGGKLSIEIYKRSRKVKNNKAVKEDRLVFVAPNMKEKPISAKMVLKGRIVAGTNKGLEEEDGHNFVTIGLPSYENGNIVKPKFKVNEETVKEVLSGISELIREDKKPEETKSLEYYLQYL